MQSTTSYTVTQRGVSSKNQYGFERKQRQDWSVGNEVKVGFLKLTVTGKDVYGCYTLVSAKGSKYTFSPREGLCGVA